MRLHLITTYLKEKADFNINQSKELSIKPDDRSIHFELSRGKKNLALEENGGIPHKFVNPSSIHLVKTSLPNELTSSHIFFLF